MPVLGFSGVHGRQTLIARRLLQRGVRYVQLWHGQGQPWDNHDNIEANHRRLAGEIDQPIAALLQADRIHPNSEAQPLLLDNAWPIISASIARSDQAVE